MTYCKSSLLPKTIVAYRHMVGFYMAFAELLETHSMTTCSVQWIQKQGSMFSTDENITLSIWLE